MFRAIISFMWPVIKPLLIAGGVLMFAGFTAGVLIAN